MSYKDMSDLRPEIKIFRSPVCSQINCGLHWLFGCKCCHCVCECITPENLKNTGFRWEPKKQVEPVERVEFSEMSKAGNTSGQDQSLKET